MGFNDLLASGDQTVRAVLGGSVTYTPGVGEAVTVTGVFDDIYVEATVVGEAGVASSGPQVFLTLSDLSSDPELDKDATVTIEGVEYKPWLVKPDGTGGVLLLLHEV